MQVIIRLQRNLLQDRLQISWCALNCMLGFILLQYFRLSPGDSSIYLVLFVSMHQIEVRHLIILFVEVEGVLESVVDDQFLFSVVDSPRIVEFKSHFHPVLEILQLMQIVSPYFKALLAAVQVLQAFSESPLIFIYEVGNHYHTGSWFSIDGVHEAALSSLHSLLHKCEDSLDGFVGRIENLYDNTSTFVSF